MKESFDAAAIINVGHWVFGLIKSDFRLHRAHMHSLMSSQGLGFKVLKVII